MTLIRKPMYPDKYDWHGCVAVEFNPKKLSGCATVGATRLSADSVFENYLAGMNAEEIVDCYDSDLPLVEQIITFGIAKGYQGRP